MTKVADSKTLIHLEFLFFYFRVIATAFSFVDFPASYSTLDCGLLIILVMIQLESSRPSRMIANSSLELAIATILTKEKNVYTKSVP